MPAHRATAFAPASVGNVAVGFDILGFAIDSLGDHVTVSRAAAPGVYVRAVRGLSETLPLEAEQNTAGGALIAMREALDLPFGFEVEIDKGIPLSAGLGGSAASAVAAVVAANSLLEAPLAKKDLLDFALRGEAIASGARHADNVAPSLFGGLVLAVGAEPRSLTNIPVPENVRAVIVHPHMLLTTKVARAILRGDVPMATFVEQTANLAGFIAGCFQGDLDLIGASLRDVVVEPQRAHLIPGFVTAREGALGAGALGCSISGAGPSIFALAREGAVDGIIQALRAPFAQQNIETDCWIVDLRSDGARLVAPLR